MSNIPKKSNNYGKFYLTKTEFEEWLLILDWSDEVKEKHREEFNYYYDRNGFIRKVTLMFDDDGLSYSDSIYNID